MGLDKANVIPTLAVTDIGQAKDFYATKLGFREVHAFMPDGSDALYRVGDQSYLYIYQRSTPSGSTATACSFAVDDVGKTVEELRARGIHFEEYDIPELGIKTIDGVANVGSVKSAWFKDPFGNILAIDDSLQVVQKGSGS